MTADLDTGESNDLSFHTLASQDPVRLIDGEWSGWHNSLHFGFQPRGTGRLRVRNSRRRVSRRLLSRGSSPQVGRLLRI